MNIASENREDKINNFLSDSMKKFTGFFLFLALTVLLLLSCNNNSSELPEYVLDQETMAMVLTDIHLIEASLQKKQNKGLLAFDLAEIYYDTLVRKYSITRLQIDSSMVYYSRYPEIYDAIYTNVITNLSKKENEITESPKTVSDISADDSLNVKHEDSLDLGTERIAEPQPQ
jgi:hypothetical protein